MKKNSKKDAHLQSFSEITTSIEKEFGVLPTTEELEKMFPDISRLDARFNKMVRKKSEIYHIRKWAPQVAACAIFGFAILGILRTVTNSDMFQEDHGVLETLQNVSSDSNVENIASNSDVKELSEKDQIDNSAIADIFSSSNSLQSELNIADSENSKESLDGTSNEEDIDVSISSESEKVTDDNVTANHPDTVPSTSLTEGSAQETKPTVARPVESSPGTTSVNSTTTQTQVVMPPSLITAKDAYSKLPSNIPQNYSLSSIDRVDDLVYSATYVNSNPGLENEATIVLNQNLVGAKSDNNVEADNEIYRQKASIADGWNGTLVVLEEEDGTQTLQLTWRKGDTEFELIASEEISVEEMKKIAGSVE